MLHARSFVWIAAAVAATSWSMLWAQDGVVPRGYGSVAGSGSGQTWDAEKSRRVVLVDKAQFPWGAGNPGVVNGIRVRRTGGVVFEMASVQKTVRVKLSATRATPGQTGTPTGPAASTPQSRLADNHGAATPTTCFAGSFGFPSTTRLSIYYQSCPVPTWTQIQFQTPFAVPADADTLVLDIEVEHAAGFSFTPAWWPEERAGLAVREFSGGFRRISSPCPAVTCFDSQTSFPCMDRCTASGLALGQQFRTDFRVGSPDEILFGWIGLLQTPGFFPGIACPYSVEPSTCQFLGFSDSSSTSVVHVWGTIPNRAELVGFPLGVQFAAFPTAMANGSAALSGAYELTIGPAPSGAVQFSTVGTACDGSGDLGGAAPCDPTSDPFAATATGALADTPVLQLY